MAIEISKGDIIASKKKTYLRVPLVLGVLALGVLPRLLEEHQPVFSFWRVF